MQNPSMKRRLVLGSIAGTAALGVVGTANSASAARSGGDNDEVNAALAFDPADHTVETRTIATGGGEVEVVYRHWHAVPYVAFPVDPEHQSLNLWEPVEIDGEPVDASDAPILFNIKVGGYMPVPIDRADLGGTNAELALAAGYVVAAPAVRGRTNVDADGVFYGKAPAAIVDLKAAVRYLRHNRGRVPGDVNRIVSTGVSAGGALSSLLGASANSRRYDPYLEAIGAADASDAIFAVAAYCPIADLEHADMAHEWAFAAAPNRNTGEYVDQEIADELAEAFTAYQDSLNLRGSGRFGRLTAARLDDHLLRTYMEPAATRHLSALPESDRAAYLAANPWITWRGSRTAGGEASFAWDDFVQHVQRWKGVPAFDGFTLGTFENSLFGDEDTDKRHFTRYSLRQGTGDEGAELEADLPEKIDLMNPMHFLGDRSRCGSRPRHWWLRTGTSDSDTSPSVMGNLVARLENLGDEVDALMYWDGGHAVNWDAPDFIAWLGETTGRTR